MLLARRLCERGAGFVTVTTNFVWDMHADVNNAGVEEGMRYMGLPFDHAVSAFIEDVHERGLSDKILLVCCGEMGRTPQINGTRRPRPLGRPRPAAALRRRTEDGPGHRPVEPHGGRAADRTDPQRQLDRDGPEHRAGHRPGAARPRHAGRRVTGGDGGGTDSGAGVSPAGRSADCGRETSGKQDCKLRKGPKK